MASSSATNPDTLIRLKVNIDNTNRRFNLPLRDLGASTLTDRLRVLLAIPPTADAVFERYSDSAAAFVVLDPNNTSVYKQLYRAAKAKLKLRLKVTVTNKEPVMPRPATVEDDVASSDERQPEPKGRYPSPPASPPLQPVKEDTVDRTSTLPQLFELRPRLEEILHSHPPCSPARRSVAATSITEIPIVRGAASRDKWFAELGACQERLQERLQARIDSLATVPPTISSYSVYCNNCNGPIPDEHYHCSTCDEGDYDLCKKCIDNGVLCGGDGHWMIKRNVKNGKVVASTTERLAPRIHASDSKTTLIELEETKVEAATRTCNSCIQEFPEDSFVTCISCEDYDLCLRCHTKLKHGHSPKHAFAPAVDSVPLDPLAEALLHPGRNVRHNAVCDGCDKYIHGVRHKCLDCPDWDFCAGCIVNANFIHPRHRFVPIYEPIAEQGIHSSNRVRHHGIFCDGPLCGGKSSYIVGDRYKCAVCHDTDFCANCEASPSNLHNKTHPLIKFKTMIRSVSVTTTGDHDNGTAMPIMGDRDRRGRTTSKSTETTPTTSTNAATQVRTVAELHPSEPVKAEEEKTAVIETTPAPVAVKQELVAHFINDAVPDGTVLPSNCIFEQTWTLQNGGEVAWPAGCSLKYVGGDYMCAIDVEHPASVQELAAATESSSNSAPVEPGHDFGFTVLMRTPPRAGRAISYWRLTDPEGNRFGHRLWCDITVEVPALAPVVKEEPMELAASTTQKEAEVVKEEIPSESSSQMIFPKLEKESPTASVHQAATEMPAPVTEETLEAEEEFSDVEDGESVDDGFLTDEEYDILDASDEEYLAEQENSVKK